MSTSIKKPCDLLSNFLTHSFLDLLEQFYIYKRHPEDTSHAKALTQSIQSFLFILQSNTSPISFLQTQIFDLLPIDLNSSSFPRISRFLSFRKAKQHYTKRLSHLPLTPTALTTYNSKLLLTYYGIIYSHGPINLHPIFSTQNSSDFLLELWRYYAVLLIQQNNLSLLHNHLETLLKKDFDIAPLLLTETLHLSQDLSAFEALSLLQKKQA